MESSTIEKEANISSSLKKLNNETELGGATRPPKERKCKMRHYEYREVNGYIVRKELHPIHRNRDGYAKVCYSVYSNKELLEKCVPDCGRYYTMKDVKEAIRMMKD